MILVTSLSPNHANKELQQECILSWKRLIPAVYSMNDPLEIELLKEQDYKGVIYYPTDRTIEHLVGKKLVMLSAMIDWAKQIKSDLFIINSDIYLKELPTLKQDGVTIFSRHDYHDNMEESKQFPHGYDAIYIPHEFLKIFPQSMYALGMAFWDHAIPLRCIAANIPLYSPKDKIAFHKWHETQYDYEQWIFVGEYFRWEQKVDKRANLGHIATQNMVKIRTKTIYV